MKKLLAILLVAMLALCSFAMADENDTTILLIGYNEDGTVFGAMVAYITVDGECTLTSLEEADYEVLTDDDAIAEAQEAFATDCYMSITREGVYTLCGMTGAKELIPDGDSMDIPEEAQNGILANLTKFQEMELNDALDLVEDVKALITTDLADEAVTDLFKTVMTIDLDTIVQVF